MKPHYLARLALLATATLLISSIALSIIGFIVFVSTPLQGPFDSYRARELTIGLSPYILLTGAFFGAWLLRSRWIQILMLIIYLVLGVYACAVGFVAWRSTGSIGTLITFPIALILSVPALVITHKSQYGRTGLST